MRKRYNCQTLPAELRSKQHAKWKAEGAIAELVDNSFGPFRGDASEVIISYDSKARTLSVLDNGKGMDHIGRIFQGGNTGGTGVGDIGEFGAGGKLAILWLAEHVDVATLRHGKVMRDSVLWKEWIAAPSFKNLGVSDDWETATLSNCPAELLAIGHGTMITMRLQYKRKIDPAKIRKELARLYSPGLRNGKSITWMTLHKGELTDSIKLTEVLTRPPATAESLQFELELLHDTDNVILNVKGVVSYDEQTSQADSKVQIGYAHRIVAATTDCFRSPDKNEQYPGIGISGWLDLGDEWRKYLSATKDGIDDEVLYLQLMQSVFEEIRPLLQKSQRKILSMEFENLAIGLEQAINQRTGGHVTVLLKAAPFPGPLPEPTGDVGGDETGKRERDPGDQPRDAAPPRLQIELIQLADEQMTGHLCRSEVGAGDKILVYINEDHTIIQEALRTKPVNKMLLNHIVVSELSGTLALEENEPFMIRMFKPQAARAIVDIDDARNRSRTLTRELIDRVRSPISDQAAE
jgi:Histidine kinase-, DNA gyrase B-, and HSP90-like ATPase